MDRPIHGAKCECTDRKLQVLWIFLYQRYVDNTLGVFENLGESLRSRVFLQNNVLVHDVMPAASAKQADIFKMRILEHLSRDRNSHIFQPLQADRLCSKNCFFIVDSAPNFVKSCSYLLGKSHVK